MTYYGLFFDVEQKNADVLSKVLGAELGQQAALLHLFDEYLESSAGGGVRVDSHEHTTLCLMAQNLLLLNNIYQLFTQGYLRSPAILLRTVAEQLILSMFFCEFPEKDKEYREKPHQDFFHENRIEKMLKQIDESGKIFKVANFRKFKFWNRHIYQNLYEEMSELSHINLNIIESLMLDKTTKKYYKQPWVYEDDGVLRIMLRKIMTSTIFSILILDKVFNPNQTEQHAGVLNKAFEYINGSLNVESAA